MILINNAKKLKKKKLYIFIIFKNLIVLINFLIIIKRIIYLYINDVNDEKIKILSLKMSIFFFFAKISIYNYFYFELNINKFDDVFSKMRMIFKKFKVSFSLKIIRVF